MPDRLARSGEEGIPRERGLRDGEQPNNLLSLRECQ